MAPTRPFRRRARLFAASLLPLLAVAQQSPPPTTTDAAAAALQSTIDAVRKAETANQRAALLGGEGFSFSFLDAKFFGGGGDAGGVVLADDTLWPGVIGTNSAMLMGFIGPCGMVAPHNHPRATEVLINVVGPPLEHGLIGENGSPPALSYAGPGNATVLPQGSMHYVANTGCDPTIIVAGFNAESPGVLFMSAAYNAFPTETYAAAFGNLAVEYLPTEQIPNTVIIGRDSCLQQCGITRQNYKQYFDPSKFTSTEILMASMGAWLKSNNYAGFTSLANGPAPYQMPSPVAMPAALMSSAPGLTGGNGGPYTPPQAQGQPNTANTNNGGPLPGFPYNQPPAQSNNRLSALSSGGNGGNNGFYGGSQNQNSGPIYGSNMGSAYYGSQAASNLLPPGQTNTGSSYYGSQGPPNSGGGTGNSGGAGNQYSTGGGSNMGSNGGSMGGSNYQGSGNMGGSYQGGSSGSNFQATPQQGSNTGSNSNIPPAYYGYPGQQSNSPNGGAMPADPNSGTGNVGSSYYGSQYQSPPNPAQAGNQANSTPSPSATPATQAKGFIPAVVILAVLNAFIIAAVIAAFVFVAKKKKRDADPFRSASVKREKHSFKGGYGYPVDQKDKHGDADDEKGHIIFHHDSRDDDPPPAPTGDHARHSPPHGPHGRPRSVSSTHTPRSLSDQPASRDLGRGRRSGSQ